MYSISYGSSGLLPHHPSICIASILGVCKCWRLAADAEEASSSCFRSAENASLKQWMAGYYFRYKSITFLLRTMTFHDISLQIIGWESFATQITSNVTENQVLWCQVQKRKNRQDDYPGRPWGRCSVPSTSPITTRAVIMTNFPFQWLCHHWGEILEPWQFLVFIGLMHG